jgi:hypothetical protein
MRKILISVGYASLLSISPLMWSSIDATNEQQEPKPSPAKHLKLRQAPESEVDLPDVTLITDKQGNQRLEMGGNVVSGEYLRMVFIVAKRDNTYRAFRLGDSKDDAKRLAGFYEKHGMDVPVSALENSIETKRLEGLARIAKRKAEHERRGQMDPEPQEEPTSGPCTESTDSSAAYQTVCTGYGDALVETWELARLVTSQVEVVNRTEAFAGWNRYPNLQDLTSYGGGNCWANPETFVYTSWYTLSCTSLYLRPSWDVFWRYRSGEYFNFDFLWDVHGVKTVSDAAVGYDGGPAFNSIWTFQNYGLWNFYEGFLLTYHVEFNGYETACVNNCQPTGIEVWECEHQESVAAWWNYEYCTCVQGASPILLDLDGDGLALTHPLAGVTFDLLGDGSPVRTGWTSGTALDAFLVLDRNGNGVIDSGTELFGNYTEQPSPKKKGDANGFLALAVFDERPNGGNGDRWIDAEDAIFSKLRLWLDTNHDGVSQAAELFSLPARGVEGISLKFREGKRSDTFGNVFRYKSRILMDSLPQQEGPDKRQAIDVWFVYYR